MNLYITKNENAMRYWALQYGPYVEVLEPESLRRQLSQDTGRWLESTATMSNEEVEKWKMILYYTNC